MNQKLKRLRRKMKKYKQIKYVETTDGNINGGEFTISQDPDGFISIEKEKQDVGYFVAEELIEALKDFIGVKHDTK